MQKLLRGFEGISNSDVKLHASLAMLANRREEIIVTNFLQSNRGVALEIGVKNISR